MSAPALAVAWRCKQTIDDLGKGIRRLVLLKCFYLLRSRRQPDQIERCTTDQRPAIGLWRGLEALLFQLRKDEAIDIRPGPGCVLGLRNRGHRKRLEGPELPHLCGDLLALDANRSGALRPGSSHLDPFGQGVDLFL